MTDLVNRQRCELTETPAKSPNPTIKCVTFMVFEEAGKTILQPLVTDKETEGVHELFQNKTLEVWLSNGQSTLDQFDVGILKYRQQLQPTKMCTKMKNRICLKNHFETIVSCKQCPLNEEGA